MGGEQRERKEAVKTLSTRRSIVEAGAFVSTPPICGGKGQINAVFAPLYIDFQVDGLKGQWHECTHNY